MANSSEESWKEAFKLELDTFQESTKDYLSSVLVFPCINSFARLKLHELAKESYPELLSFSVGIEPERRPVICRQQLVAEWTLKSVNLEPQVTPFVNPTVPNKQGKRPEKALYVPKGSDHKPRGSKLAKKK